MRINRTAVDTETEHAHVHPDNAVRCQRERHKRRLPQRKAQGKRTLHTRAHVHAHARTTATLRRDATRRDATRRRL
eukprot:EW704616.1.p2 GENE.EW704616.1~~EW704616.1.p2  ORF type:complete len:76 (-),score=15.31 EW704616.1:136-363(-)